MDRREIIKSDLLNLEPIDFYLKHIVKSHNWYFSDYLGFTADEIIDKMDSFKEIVSSRFNINFHNVQIVGSAKVGYSLSPKKLLQPFHEERPGQPSSDIDIAVISDELYKYYWNKIRKEKGIWNSYYYNNLTISIFRGYINQKDLLKIKGITEEWSNIINPINVDLQDHLGFIHPITYRLYRSWDDLQEYQLSSITKAKHSLEGNYNV